MRPELIAQALEHAKLGAYDSVVTAFKSTDAVHPAAGLTPAGNGMYEPVLGREKAEARRQVRQEVFFRSGQVYVFRTEALLLSKSLYSGSIGIVEVPFEEAITIDSLRDFEIASEYLGKRPIPAWLAQ